MKKMLGKVKGFLAVLLAVVMVLGVIAVPSGMVMGAEVPAGKANEGDYEDANVVAVTWQNDGQEVKTVYVHYVDEDGNSILDSAVKTLDLATAKGTEDVTLNGYTYNCYDLSRTIDARLGWDTGLDCGAFDAYQLKGVYTKVNWDEKEFTDVYDKDTDAPNVNRITSYLVYNIKWTNKEFEDDTIRYEAEWVDRRSNDGMKWVFGEENVAETNVSKESITEYLNKPDSWAKNADRQHIFLVYEQRAKKGDTDGFLVNGEDIYNNDKLGLKMYIFDYLNEKGEGQGPNGKYLWGENDKFGRDEKLNEYPKYYSDYLKDADENFNNEGFPFYYNKNIKTETGEEYKVNMADWFNPDHDKNAYYDVEADRLFQKDDKGIYFYNSAWNAAVLDMEKIVNGKANFKLYKNLVAPCDNYAINKMNAGDNANRIAGKDPYKRGNFFPYNDIDVSKVWSYVPCVLDGEIEAYKNQPVFGLKCYENGAWVPYPDDVASEDASQQFTNHHFGMYMVGTIQQRFSSQDENENDDLVYSISGDDDIVIYIDGIKVVDLGGIHGKVEARINFTTGKVKYDIDENTHVKRETNLREIMQEVAKNNTDVDISGIDFNGDTFAPGTTHTMKVFYAERGYGASNLYITLSVPNEGAIPVKNEFYYKDTGATDYTKKDADEDTAPDEGKYKNVEYRLYYADEVENGVPKDEATLLGRRHPSGKANWTDAFTGLDTTREYVLVAVDTSPEEMFGGSDKYKHDNTNVQENKSGETVLYSKTISFENAQLEDDILVADPVVIRNYYSEIKEEQPVEQPKLGKIPVENKFYYKDTGATVYIEKDTAPDDGGYDKNVKYYLYYADENGDPTTKAQEDPLVPDGTERPGAFTGLDTTKKYVVVVEDTSKMFGGNNLYKHDNTNAQNADPTKESLNSKTISFEGATLEDDILVADPVVVRNYYSAVKPLEDQTNKGTIPVQNTFYYKETGVPGYTEKNVAPDGGGYNENVKYWLYYADENGNPTTKAQEEPIVPDGTEQPGVFTGLDTTKKYVVVVEDTSKMFGGNDSYKHDNTNVQKNNPEETVLYSETVSFKEGSFEADPVVIRNYYSAVPTTSPTTESPTPNPPTTESPTPESSTEQAQNTEEDSDEEDDEEDEKEEDAKQKNNKNGTKTGDQAPIVQTLIFLLNALCGIVLCVIIKKCD